MTPSSLLQLFKPSTLSRRFIIVTVMFVCVLLGLLAYTITVLHRDHSTAVLIDTAGRQRMLFQQHFNEVLLTSQGAAADYASTRHLIHSTLNALMNGGTVIANLETDQPQTVPAVPTQEIFETLRQQQAQSKHVFQLADRFLTLRPDHPEFQPQLQTLRTQHALVIQTADQAVKQLNTYSSTAISTMVKWELVMALVVGLLGILATNKVIRDGRRLEKDVEERKERGKSLQEWKALTDSMLGQLPKGFAYRCLNNKKWTIIYASDGIERVTGIPASEFLSGAITYDTLLAPGENERVWPIVQVRLPSVFHTKTSIKLLPRMERKNGFWQEAVSCLIIQANSSI